MGGWVEIQEDGLGDSDERPPSPAAVPILAKLAEAAKAGIKAKQTEK